MENHKAMVVDTARILTGVGYIFGMFINGIVVIGMEMNLDTFSSKCGVSLSRGSAALIFRSIGSAIGTLIAGKALSLLEPHYVLYAQVFFAAVLLETIVWVRSINAIYVIFFFMGLLVCIVQTTCLLMIRRVFAQQGGGPGPWLQCASFGFQVGVAVFPAFMEVLPFSEMYHTLASITVATALYGCATVVFCLPNFKDELLQKEDNDSADKTVGVVEHASSSPESASTTIVLVARPKISKGDFIAATSIFFVCGFIVQTTTYLSSFITQTTSDSLPLSGTNALLGLTLSILIAQVLILPFQKGATTPLVLRLFLGLCACTAWSQLVPVLFASAEGPSALRRSVLWLFALGSGLGWGPLPGLLFDLWDRCTPEPTAWGAAALNFGIYAGSGFYSNGMFAVWTSLRDPLVLPWANFLAMCLAAAAAVALRLRGRGGGRRVGAAGEEEEEEEEGAGGAGAGAPRPAGEGTPLLPAAAARRRSSAAAGSDSSSAVGETTAV